MFNSDLLRSFGNAFGTNLALAMAGQEARPIIETLLGGLSDDDIAFMVTNSVNIVGTVPDKVLAPLRQSLKEWQPLVEVVLRDGNLPKFLAAASPQRAVLLDALPGGMEWLSRQIVSLL